jgi:hypothetical protein
MTTPPGPSCWDQGLSFPHPAPQRRAQMHGHGQEYAPTLPSACCTWLDRLPRSRRWWWRANWPSASEPSARVADQCNVRDARPDTGVERIYHMGGHIIFGQDIAGPRRLPNFLCGQLKGKKLGQMPSPTCGKERVPTLELYGSEGTR